MIVSVMIMITTEVTTVMMVVVVTTSSVSTIPFLGGAAAWPVDASVHASADVTGLPGASDAWASAPNTDDINQHHHHHHHHHPYHHPYHHHNHNHNHYIKSDNSRSYNIDIMYILRTNDCIITIDMMYLYCIGYDSDNRSSNVDSNVKALNEL